MTLSHACLLFLVTILAGSMNSLAGAGNLLAFPMLIFLGIPPISANATTSVGLWPGSLAGIGGYRKRLPRNLRLLLPLMVASLAGGIAGALLLLHTSPRTFMRIVPFLFLGATILFVYERRIGRSTAARGKMRPLGWTGITATAVAQFAIATYGGFFGGGVGILMLALFSVAHLGDIHTMNSVRVLMASVTKSLAVIAFIVANVVSWPAALVMATGAVVGGYGGARLAQKIDPKIVQAFVVVVGLVMAVYFFWRY